MKKKAKKANVPGQAGIVNVVRPLGNIEVKENYSKK